MSARVVITGGHGFVGRALARRLVERGELAGLSISEIVAFDQADAEDDPVPGVVTMTGDICDRERVAALVEADGVVVFHLASIVSGAGERDFDLALRVNLDGTRNVLEACRAQGNRPRVVFASTISVFGGTSMPENVGDTTKHAPETTYGMTKSVGELLLNDYTRKGFVDGRSARLPTVIIRPGAPNAAISGFASAVFREPLAGRDYTVPVGASTRIPVIGERTAVDGFVRLAEVDGADIGDDRGVNLPSLSVTVEEMLATLHRVAGSRVLAAVELAPSPEIESVVARWPRRSTCERALGLALPADTDLDSILQTYIDQYVTT